MNTLCGQMAVSVFTASGTYSEHLNSNVEMKFTFKTEQCAFVLFNDASSNDPINVQSFNR
jgi:hypothetical protein